MVWTQALLWLVMGIIIGAFFHRWLATVGERHMRIVALSVSDDDDESYVQIHAVGVLETAPARKPVPLVGVKDPRPPSGFMDQHMYLPLTPALRDGLRRIFSNTARYPNADYIAPFVYEHEGQRFIDLEMSVGGRTVNLIVDARGVDELVKELHASKEALLAPPTVETAPPAKAST